MGKVVDPVIVEVVRNLLLSVADETNTVIIKSAYSTNIKERRDNTVAIYGCQGRRGGSGGREVFPFCWPLRCSLPSASW